MTICAWCARELLGDPEDYPQINNNLNGETFYFCCDDELIHHFFKHARRMMRELDRKQH